MSSDSYAQSGRRKRQKVLASGAQVPKHRSSKNTKRWCKGVVGREHVYVWQEWRAGWPTTRVYSEERCKNCKKRRSWLLGAFSGALGPAF